MRPAPARSSAPTDPVMRAVATSDYQEDSRSSSSNSPAPPDNEESDFFLVNNDSQSSIGVPNVQDMALNDICWPPVNTLPNEILIQIFSKLSTPSDLFHCMQTCKRWARNTVDLLWHRPACTNWKNHSSICQTLGLETPFFAYADFIRRLNLAALADKVNDGSVMPLAVCSRVERLTLTSCRKLTDIGLIALVQGNTSLLAIDISNDKDITEKSINVIAENCKRLQGLNISGCENISNESMVNLAQSCRYIKRLKLNECVQLRDDAVVAFAENCPNMLEIDLQQCAHIGNGPITSLLAKGECLRELRLANCENIDDNAFLSLPSEKTFGHLRILDLTSCHLLTDTAVSKIIEAAPRLRNLVLAKCRNITDASLISVSKLGKNLHYMHLGHCHNITDDGVNRLISSCNRIRYIDLGCCTNLTDDSVKRLALLPKLKRIGLVKCNLITDISVNALAEAAFRPRVRKDANGYYVGGEYYASSLERVHLSYCTNLTLKSIIRLLNSCPRLTHLSVTGVAAFQRDDFQPFCRQAPPEFTQHQRDVFCVFSGGMVSQFRTFLNTAPEFEEIREGSSRRGMLNRVRGHPVHQSSQQAPEGTPRSHGPEPFEDDMADEDNDDEVVHEGMLGADGQTQIEGFPPALAGVGTTFTSSTPTLDANTQVLSRPLNTPGLQIPIPPPPPGLPQFAHHHHHRHHHRHHQNHQNHNNLTFIASSAYSTFNPHAHATASVASGRPSQINVVSSGLSNGGQSSNSASTASMHQPSSQSPDNNNTPNGTTDT